MRHAAVYSYLYALARAELIAHGILLDSDRVRRKPRKPLVAGWPGSSSRADEGLHLDPLILGREPRADLTHCEPVQRRHRSNDFAFAVHRVPAGPIVPSRARGTRLTGGAPESAD